MFACLAGLGGIPICTVLAANADHFASRSKFRHVALTLVYKLQGMMDFQGSRELPVSSRIRPVGLRSFERSTKLGVRVNRRDIQYNYVSWMSLNTIFSDFSMMLQWGVFMKPQI